MFRFHTRSFPRGQLRRGPVADCTHSQVHDFSGIIRSITIFIRIELSKTAFNPLEIPTCQMPIRD